MITDNELLSFYEWRVRYRYRDGKPIWYYDDDSREYKRYLDEHWETKYRNGRGPEIDEAIKEHSNLSYDELVNLLGVKAIESINFKLHQECKLFRCLVCWMMINPEDEIINHKDGYAHKICIEGKSVFPRRPTNKERLYEERAECRKCHHSKRVHSEFGYGCFGHSGRNEYGCDCQGWMGYKDKRIV